jgi:hypothetical protein
LPELEITILYRDKIRVFYKNAKEARSNDYHDFDTQDRDGYIYAFTGLRGDAKQLYQDIRVGKEHRVKLV